MKICIFLEKYLFPEIYFPFLYNFLNDLSKIYNLFIYFFQGSNSFFNLFKPGD